MASAYQATAGAGIAVMTTAGVFAGVIAATTTTTTTQPSHSAFDNNVFLALFAAALLGAAIVAITGIHFVATWWRRRATPESQAHPPAAIVGPKHPDGKMTAERNTIRWPTTGIDASGAGTYHVRENDIGLPGEPVTGKARRNRWRRFP